MPMKKMTIALAGNPNSGKTTIFNALTGARQHVGNWPGVTVERKEGRVLQDGHEIEIVDLPGTYSLTALSIEEIIARNFIVDGVPDVVVDVVDASNLERNLYLTAQLLEMGANVVVALNMIDVARGRGININERHLSELLGVPVISTDGKRELGIKDLLSMAVGAAQSRGNINESKLVQYGAEVEEEIGKIRSELVQTGIDDKRLSQRWTALKLLEADPEISKKLEAMIGRDGVFAHVDVSRRHLAAIFGDAPETILADARYGFISGALKRTVKVENTDRVHLSEKVDKVLTHRLVGPVVLMLVLYGVYTLTFQGGAPLQEGFQSFFDWVAAAAADNLPEGLLQSLMVNGVIKGAGGVLAFTPLIALMFLAIAILEDTGYMARIAFMMDRLMHIFGLHGASILALMVSGGLAGGCAVPGVMSTRTMREPKERLTTILVTPLMNCGAKLPVYALLIGAFFSAEKALIMFYLTLISWGMVLLAGRIIRSTLLKGPSAPFVLELPPYRIPTLKGLLIHSWERTWLYIKKAGTIILAVSILLWSLMTFPNLSTDRLKVYEDGQAKLAAEFLSKSEVQESFKSEADLEAFEKFQGEFKRGAAADLQKQNPALFRLAKALEVDAKGKGSQKDGNASDEENPVVKAYSEFAEGKKELENDKQAAKLKNSVAGRIGVALESVFAPLGFDWKTNIALVGGFAAKEVVVSTLGIAYGLGEVDTQDAGSLSDRLRQDSEWSPLKAFTLLIFVMLYAPCVTTLVVMRKETGGWRWPLFATFYTTTLAFAVAMLVNYVGRLAGWGLS
ncbi:MAG: ferrous iron transport protein B [Desulfomonile tiedjei]|uniref:Ferrous iron transport protein B n=1 Tax=Desulfomonile tiedjei TaxID=2358 RepID=A0A9D6Z1T2_9BACT|nr:ferrous iron transport protein B [Desulfomonile tiedjei]